MNLIWVLSIVLAGLLAWLGFIAWAASTYSGFIFAGLVCLTALALFGWILANWSENKAQAMITLLNLKTSWYLWLPALVLSLLAGWVQPNWYSSTYRDVPVAFLYFRACLLWWLGIVILRGVLDPPAGLTTICWIGDWVRKGGCWKIWSRENSPANSLLVFWILITFAAFLYGRPTRNVDPAMVHYYRSLSLYQNAEKAKSNLEPSVARQVLASTVGSLTETVVGKNPWNKLPGVHVPPKPNIPKPLYKKGWWLIGLSLALLPLVLSGIVASRRDGAAEFCIRQAERIHAWIGRKAVRTEAAAPGQTPADVAAAVAQRAVAGATEGGGRSFGQMLGVDLVGGILAGLLIEFSKWAKRT